MKIDLPCHTKKGDAPTRNVTPELFRQKVELADVKIIAITNHIMLIVFACIIFTIVQHTWNSMAIRIVMELFLVLITAGTGVMEGVLEMASESLGGFMKS